MFGLTDPDEHPLPGPPTGPGISRLAVDGARLLEQFRSLEWAVFMLREVFGVRIPAGRVLPMMT
jgi:hypothetical protein